MPRTATGLDVRPLTARSAILSVLLGAHPPAASGADVVEWGRRVGVSESAVRVALSRMVGAGDLVRHDGVYALAPRLVQRQARQDRALDRPRLAWDGRWLVAVTTAVGSDAASRARLRQAMTADLFGELREGVWMRPANLDWAPGADVAPSVEVMSAVPTTPPAELASRVFDLDAWAARASALLDALDGATDLRDRLPVAAAIVRHLVLDPLLPDQLVSPAWPAADLRAAYAAFRTELVGLQRA